MPSPRAIRIIKREERELVARKPDDTKSQNQTRRELFKTIKVWIEEQRETKEELYSLAKALSVPAVDSNHRDAE